MNLNSGLFLFEEPNMKMVKRLMSGVKGKAAELAVGAVAAVGSASAFAQASGATINDTGIVSSISGVTGNVQDIGAAVLAVVVCAWGYRIVKGFLGR
jgi:hypothetical protein